MPLPLTRTRARRGELEHRLRACLRADLDLAHYSICDRAIMDGAIDGTAARAATSVDAARRPDKV
jgi:hypothetical protein